jgi:hypothetical protein
MNSILWTNHTMSASLSGNRSDKLIHTDSVCMSEIPAHCAGMKLGLQNKSLTHYLSSDQMIEMGVPIAATRKDSPNGYQENGFKGSNHAVRHRRTHRGACSLARNDCAASLNPAAGAGLKKAPSGISSARVSSLLRGSFLPRAFPTSRRSRAVSRYLQAAVSKTETKKARRPGRKRARIDSIEGCLSTVVRCRVRRKAMIHSLSAYRLPATRSEESAND